MKCTERLLALRKEHTFTQNELAKILHTSQAVYSRYESGACKLPVCHLIRLCGLYNVSSDYILGLTDQRLLP